MVTSTEDTWHDQLRTLLQTALEELQGLEQARPNARYRDDPLQFAWREVIAVAGETLAGPASVDDLVQDLGDVLDALDQGAPADHHHPARLIHDRAWDWMARVVELYQTRTSQVT